MRWYSGELQSAVGGLTFGGTCAISDYVEAEAERFFAALGEGGLITTPLEKTFWTAKFGMLQDRFGVTWMVSIEHKPGPGT